ncbi:hypothetical protein [Jeotgalibacillus sp. R-1-5s-1]|uniref:hypothetical protein n=1 Tax=Jeotgalibacillus sp. R-1-5s-1 TaxID=2555897 RepID=UPI00106AD636|nr:hypothetical protein [Jeotgalibacillus sp. R-1-5s-1]TFD95951.1 hypothetical protein E2491_12340 [Jeotgalibacillus sp. R-1-5s-1]
MREKSKEQPQEQPEFLYEADEIKKAELLSIMMGYGESEKPEAVSHVLSQSDQKRDIIKAFIRYGESNPPEGPSMKVSAFAEDQELHQSIQSLPYTQKVLVLLTSFYPITDADAAAYIGISEEQVKVEKQEAYHTLAESTNTEQDQIPAMLTFLNKAYKKVPLTLQQQDFTAVDQAGSTSETKAKGKNWPAVTTAAVILLAGGLAFALNDPIPEETERTAAANEEREEEEEFIIPEEEIDVANQELENKKEELVVQLGLSAEEVNQLPVVEMAKGQLMHLEYLNEQNDPYYSNLSEEELRQEIDVIKDSALLSIAPPLSFLNPDLPMYNQWLPEKDLYTTSDVATAFFHDYAQSLRVVYEEKLNAQREEMAPWSRSYFKESELPEDERVLREKIRENGFDFEYDFDQNRFHVMIGGENFDTAIMSLDPVFQQVLNNLPELNLGIYGELHHSGTQSPDDHLKALLKIDENINFLHESSPDMSDPFTSSSFLFSSLNQFEMLFAQYISGSPEKMIFENGFLKEDVKQSWEKVLADESLKGKEIYKVVDFQYRLLKNNNFELLRGIENTSFLLYPDIRHWYHFNGNSTFVDFPLEHYHGKVYELYTTPENRNMLSVLQAEQIAMLYLNSIKMQDTEVLYSFFEPTDKLPSLEEFQTLVPPDILGKLELDRMNNIYVNSTGSNDSLSVNVEKNDGTMLIITMVKTDEGYKVKFTSDQMFNRY